MATTQQMTDERPTSRKAQDAPARRRGRPPAGADLVDGLASGSPEARRRLKAILRTLSGELTIDAACAETGLSRSRFCEIRRDFLEDSATLLEPGVPGPKPQERDEEIEQLRRDLERAEESRMVAELREELLLIGREDDAGPLDDLWPRSSSRVKKKKSRDRRRRSR